jgi:hypothetical protein
MYSQPLINALLAIIFGITIQWKRRITIAMFNSSLKFIPSFPCAPHCGRYVQVMKTVSIFLLLCFQLIASPVEMGIEIYGKNLNKPYPKTGIDSIPFITYISSKTLKSGNLIDQEKLITFALIIRIHNKNKPEKVDSAVAIVIKKNKKIEYYSKVISR